MNDAPSVAALDACAAEPIRIPGAIQPHGALVVVAPDDLTVLQASANFEAVIGVATIAGRSLDDLFNNGALVTELRRWLASDDLTFMRVIDLRARRLQVYGHRTDQGVILEFEAPPLSETESLDGLYPRLHGFLDSIAKASDIRAIAQVTVREVRALTGFNRVMLYSFDEAGDGTVLAEDGDGVLPSYLGQRFPAADIPAQARALYTLSRIRLIADVDYIPALIEPRASPIDGQPLDLSRAGLRSVSPIHLEYMRNMGTESSMSISIVVNGMLWGLVSGHSRAPRQINAQVRVACDMLGQVLSLQVEARERARHSAERLALKQVETELLARLAGARPFQRGLMDNATTWMALTRAQGAAVITRDAVLSVGLTPPDAGIRALAARLHQHNTDIFDTDSMSGTWPETIAFAERASGLLAVSISRIHPDYILWFRPEVIQTIEWSGDPTKTLDPRGLLLHPRQSFELWKQQVRLHSPRWTTSEIDSAHGFRSSIQDLVLRSAEERAELTERLERLNHELESFSYSISHDLRAPFRHIVGYAELLADRERELDKTSQHYMETIKASAIAAGRLVDDLLHFSQLGRTQLGMSSVDMRKLVLDVRRTLEQETAGRAIEWRVGHMPQAWGDISLLRQVLQNLLQNAIKYSAPRSPAVISISGREDGDTTVYVIADNGIGFEMAYVDKLFGVFQRLHRAEEFEGTGIGLALVKRIVDRHGGSVSARGTPGEGAQFTFVLPKRAVSKGEEHRG